MHRGRTAAGSLHRPLCFKEFYYDSNFSRFAWFVCFLCFRPFFASSYCSSVTYASRSDQRAFCSGETMISCYFGLPGCGKTTILAKLAVTEQRKIDQGLSRYKFVYTNVQVNYPGIKIIKWDDIGKKALNDCLILIDEATLYADSRAYKSFPEEKVNWFCTHRHDCADLIYFAQFFDAVDKRMRMVTDKVFYCRKWPFGFSTYIRIPKAIVIPEQTGDIVEGYRMPSFFEKLLLRKVIYRRPWYRFFDSWVSYAKRPPVIAYTVPGSPRVIDSMINRYIVSPVTGLLGK
jgi:hypothetical protein